ncbi:hypothetical protein EV401DRAFT_1893690 [Pisolithus croceorrhizus]|nr:hypothetical protein EV401DRAFT_1893690 [Pisolithus croceorrhizus]
MSWEEPIETASIAVAQCLDLGGGDSLHMQLEVYHVPVIQWGRKTMGDEHLRSGSNPGGGVIAFMGKPTVFRPFSEKRMLMEDEYLQSLAFLKKRAVFGPFAKREKVDGGRMLVPIRPVPGPGGGVVAFLREKVNGKQTFAPIRQSSGPGGDVVAFVRKPTTFRPFSREKKLMEDGCLRPLDSHQALEVSWSSYRNSLLFGHSAGKKS